VELVENDPLDVTAGPPSGDRCVAVRPGYHKIPALSVLSAMFLHGGLLHLVGNMLFLFVFGNNVEDRLGRVRYLLFYLACGYLATYGFALSDPASEQTWSGRRGPSPGCSAPTWSCSPGPVTSLVPFLFFIPVWLPAWSCSAPGSSCSGSTSRAPPPPRVPAWPTLPTSSGSRPAWS
jgi:hypothetical protein